MSLPFLSLFLSGDEERWRLPETKLKDRVCRVGWEQLGSWTESKERFGVVRSKAKLCRYPLVVCTCLGASGAQGDKPTPYAHRYIKAFICANIHTTQMHVEYIPLHYDQTHGRGALLSAHGRAVYTLQTYLFHAHTVIQGLMCLCGNGTNYVSMQAHVLYAPLCSQAQ